MLDFLLSMFSSLNSSPITEPGNPRARRQIGYGKELKVKSSCLNVKKTVRFELESWPLLEKEEIDVEKCGKKLKVVMRKEAACRLLSKCKDGGILEYKDVANDLNAIPATYVRLFSYNAKDD